MPSKTELRAAAMSEVGNRLDDELERAQGLAKAAAGAAAAFDQAIKDVGKNTIPHVQSLIDQEQISMREGQLVIDWLTKAINIIKNLHGEARTNCQKLEGVSSGLSKAVQATAALHSRELSKVSMIDDTVPQSDRQAPRRETLKEKRLREESMVAPDVLIAARQDPVHETKGLHSKVTKKKVSKKKAAKKRATKNKT